MQWDPSIEEKEGDEEGGTGKAEPSGGSVPGGGAGPSGRADSPDEAGPSGGAGPRQGGDPDTSGDAALANQLALMDSGDEVMPASPQHQMHHRILRRLVLIRRIGSTNNSSDCHMAARHRRPCTLPQQDLEGAKAAAEPEAGPSGGTRPRRSAAGGSASAAGERFQVDDILLTQCVASPDGMCTGCASACKAMNCAP